MKKFFAFAVLAVASLCASAENFYVGGSLGFWHDSEDNQSTNTLSILPEIGYNLSDNWAVGTTIGYNFGHTCNEGISTHIFEFNPYVRFTFFKTENNLVNLFVDGGAGIGAGWTSYKHGDDSETAITWNVGFRPGVALNLTDKFSVVAHVGMLGYNGANNAAKATGLYHDNGGFLLNGNNLSFGFYYHF